MLISATEQAAREDWHKADQATTCRVIALRTPSHQVVYPASDLANAKLEAARYHSDGGKVTLKWHTETRIAKTATTPAQGTCTNCSGIISVDCGIACTCGWEVGHCNTRTGEIYGMSSIGAAEAAREALHSMINGEDSFEDLRTF